MTSSYAPDVQAEIDRQVVQAEIANLTTGGVQFAGEMLADNTLLSDGNLLGSMQMSSDPGSRDYVTLYSTETGQPSRVLVNMLSKKLAMRSGGQPVWSTKPTKDYFVGTLKCLLHEDSPRRAEFDAIGLVGKTCTKDNIPSAFEVRQHMLHRHRQEWQVIEEAREAAEREEERAFRRALMAQSAPQEQRTRRTRTTVPTAMDEIQLED